MEKYIKILEKSGLTEKQSLVYMSLLHLGEIDMTKLAKHAGLKRPTVYLIIDELDLLGLVSIVTKGKKKIYSAINPKRIGELLEFRKSEFTEILPDLLAEYKQTTNKPSIQMFEGLAGVRRAYSEAFDLLSSGKEGLWFGNIGVLIDQYPEIMREYNHTLGNIRKYTIREIIFGGVNSKNWVEKMNTAITKRKIGVINHEIKYLADENNSGLIDQFIVGNKIFIFSLSPQEVFTTIIESAELSKTYTFIFNQIWKNL